MGDAAGATAGIGARERLRPGAWVPVSPPRHRHIPTLHPNTHLVMFLPSAASIAHHACGKSQVELFEAALEAGNWATADWLYRRGLLGPGCTPQQEQWHLQRVFRDVAGQMGDSSDDSRVVPTLWHLYRWCNMQWSTKCRRALQECAVRAAHLGRLRVVSGQARQTREMLRDADAALAVGRCGGGARRESVVSEEEGSEESEESEE